MGSSSSKARKESDAKAYVPTTESDDPFDMLATARDPYGAERKARRNERFAPASPSKHKSNFREGVSPGAPPSVLVDSRLAQFREMGFDAAAAEAALAAANNDVDAALTALLAAKADE